MVHEVLVHELVVPLLVGEPLMKTAACAVEVETNDGLRTPLDAVLVCGNATTKDPVAAVVTCDCVFCCDGETFGPPPEQLARSNPEAMSGIRMRRFIS
jgi:hypothetical protein